MNKEKEAEIKVLEGKQKLLEEQRQNISSELYEIEERLSVLKSDFEGDYTGKFVKISDESTISFVHVESQMQDSYGVNFIGSGLVYWEKTMTGGKGCVDIKTTDVFRAFLGIGFGDPEMQPKIEEITEEEYNKEIKNILLNQSLCQKIGLKG